MKRTPVLFNNSSNANFLSSTPINPSLSLNLKENNVLFWNGREWIGGFSMNNSQGPTGPRGSVGEAGPQGFTGEAGSQGPQGSVGQAGSQGSVGEAGPQGFTGEAGSQGHQGSVGQAGSQGSVGEAGSQGSVGEAGPQGFTGEAGPQGFTGEAGPQGSQGSQGSQGFTGEAGSQGSQGSVGEAGPQGFTGEAGPQGDGLFGLKSIRISTALPLPEYTFSENNLTSNTNYSLNKNGIDSVKNLEIEDRILVKDEPESKYNGIYQITSLGSNPSGSTFPIEPSMHIFTGTIHSVIDQDSLNDALSNSTDGDIIEIPSNTTITITSNKIINKSLEIRGQDKDTSIITASYAPNANTGLFIISGTKANASQNNNVYIHDLTIISNSNTTDHSLIACNTLSTTFNNGSTGMRFENLNLNHTEFAITIASESWVIKNCTFSYNPSSGAADTSRHIGIYNISTIGWIEGCVFNCTTETIPRIICIALLSSNYDFTPGANKSGGYSGDLVIKNCSQGIGNLRQWLVQEVFKANGLNISPMAENNFSIWAENNTHNNYSASSFALFSGSGISPLNFFDTLYFVNNNIGAGLGTKKGLLAVDGVGTKRNAGSPTNLLTSGNTINDTAFGGAYQDGSTIPFLIGVNTSIYDLPSPLISPTISSPGSPWILTRTNDKLIRGSFVNINEGSINKGTSWILISQDPITLNNSSLEWRLKGGYLNSIPATSISNGNTGSMSFDSDYIYICINNNLWKRISLSEW
jgi:hypothetical protein